MIDNVILIVCKYAMDGEGVTRYKGKLQVGERKV